MGDGEVTGLGADALLDFSVALSLDGEPISEAEWRAIAAGASGLALVKGRWVEAEAVLTEMGDEDLIRFVTMDTRKAVSEA